MLPYKLSWLLVKCWGRKRKLPQLGCFQGSLKRKKSRLVFTGCGIFCNQKEDGVVEEIKRWGRGVMLGLPLVSKKQEKTGACSKAEEEWPVPTAILWVCRDDYALKILLHNWCSDSFGNINGLSESWGHGEIFLVHFFFIVLNEFSVWKEGKLPPFPQCSSIRLHWKVRLWFSGPVIRSSLRQRCVVCVCEVSLQALWWWQLMDGLSGEFASFKLVHSLLGREKNQMER